MSNTTYRKFEYLSIAKAYHGDFCDTKILRIMYIKNKNLTIIDNVKLLNTIVNLIDMNCEYVKM